jgi:hypothetical protein
LLELFLQGGEIFVGKFFQILAKAQALPSTIDERLAKIRKASLTTQKKSRDPSRGLAFSFCVFIVVNIIVGTHPQRRRQRLYVPTKNCGAAHPAASANTTAP